MIELNGGFQGYDVEVGVSQGTDLISYGLYELILVCYGLEWQSTRPHYSFKGY